MQDINSFLGTLNNFFAQGLYTFILQPQFSAWALVVKFVFITVSFILAVMIFWLLTVSTWFARAYKESSGDFKNFTPFDAKSNAKQWLRIKKRLTSDKEIQFKLAVIEADDYLDRILRALNYDGKSIEERIKQLDVEVLSNLEELKEAHKVRNDIVYNRGFQLTDEKARGIIDIYEKSLKNLRAI